MMLLLPLDRTEWPLKQQRTRQVKKGKEGKVNSCGVKVGRGEERVVAAVLLWTEGKREGSSRETAKSQQALQCYFVRFTWKKLQNYSYHFVCLCMGGGGGLVRFVFIIKVELFAYMLSHIISC
jgi:hypothetical protein